jgi:hypothetical protein
MSTRIEEIRAQRSALAEAKAQRDAEAKAQQEIDSEEQALLDEQALDSAELEHGPSFVYPEGEAGDLKLAIVKTPSGRMILIKRSAPSFFRRFIDAGKNSLAEYEKLVLPNVVYPDQADFKKLLADQVAILPVCADAIAVMAGTRVQSNAGKSAP